MARRLEHGAARTWRGSRCSSGRAIVTGRAERSRRCAGGCNASTTATRTTVELTTALMQSGLQLSMKSNVPPIAAGLPESGGGVPGVSVSLGVSPCLRSTVLSSLRPISSSSTVLTTDQFPPASAPPTGREAPRLGRDRQMLGRERILHPYCIRYPPARTSSSPACTHARQAKRLISF